MEDQDQRFLVSLTSGTTYREFEVVPNIGHYAILENDVTIAELTAGDNWTQTSGEALPTAIIADLGVVIEQHYI